MEWNGYIQPDVFNRLTGEIYDIKTLPDYRKEIEEEKDFKINYLNLSNGLEFLLDYEEYFIVPPKLVRIQSSQLEASAYWKVIEELDYGFLIDAALYGVNLWDCGSRRGAESRAQWLGVPWICYVWSKRAGSRVPDWIPQQLVVNFQKHYCSGKNFHSDAKKKIDYCIKMTGEDNLDIDVIYENSQYDGEYDTLATILQELY